MHSLEIIENLVDKGCSREEIAHILRTALSENYLVYATCQYKELKDLIQAELEPDIDSFYSRYADVSFVNSIELNKIRDAWSRWSKAFSDYKSTDSYNHEKCSIELQNSGFTVSLKKDHQMHKPAFLDVIDSMNLCDEYRLPLNVQHLYLFDKWGDYEVMFDNYQLAAIKDDTNWFIINRHGLVLATQGRVIYLTNKQDYERVYRSDFVESDPFVESDFDSIDAITVDESDTVTCILLGEMHYKENFERYSLRFADEPVFGTVFDAKTENHRILVRPYKIFSDAHFYVDSLGYINNELAYFSIKPCFPEYYEKRDDRDELPSVCLKDLKGQSYWLRETMGFRYFTHYESSNVICADPEKVRLKHGLLFKSDVPSHGPYYLTGNKEQHVYDVFEKNGYMLFKPGGRYHTGLMFTDQFSSIDKEEC